MRARVESGRALTGHPRRVPFSVRVKGRGAPVTLGATFVQRPWLSSLFMRALAIFTTVAFIAAAGIFIVLSVSNHYAPKVTAPLSAKVGAAKSAVPKVKVPKVTVPKVTVPKVTVPAKTVPAKTVPAKTVPNGTAPTTVPKGAPPTTVLEGTVPTTAAGSPPAGAASGKLGQTTKHVPSTASATSGTVTTLAGAKPGTARRSTSPTSTSPTTYPATSSPVTGIGKPGSTGKAGSGGRARPSGNAVRGRKARSHNLIAGAVLTKAAGLTVATASGKEISISGQVKAPDPGGVTVTVQATSLVAEPVPGVTFLGPLAVPSASCGAPPGRRSAAAWV